MLCISRGGRGMASDLSSGCTEVNDLLDDEKEEGEISLEDVSSSEEGPPYKYQPRAFGQCPYCLSTQHCATWCRSLTVNKTAIKRDAGLLQGKENRSNQHSYHKDHVLDNNTNPSNVSGITITANLVSKTSLQEKNNDAAAIVASINQDLVPISSDSDMELVGLGLHEVKPKKKSRRRGTNATGTRKTRKKRRKKSPTLSLSLSPSSLDLAISVKESIHRVEPSSSSSALIKKDKEGHSKSSRHHSPDKKKTTSKVSPPARRHNRSPPPGRRRTRSPLPRKTSPLRIRKILPKKPPLPVEPINQEDALQEPPSSRGNVTKLLKKVRRLEPFSSRSREKGSSLKDKLSNIIQNDKREMKEMKEKKEKETKEKKEKETKEKENKETKEPKEKKETETKITKEKKDTETEMETKATKETETKTTKETTETETKVTMDAETKVTKETKEAETKVTKDTQETKETTSTVESNKENSADATIKEESTPVVPTVKEEVKEVAKEPPIEEKKSIEENVKSEEDDDDLVVLRQIALGTKHKKFTPLLRPEDIKTEPLDHPPPSPPTEPPPPTPSPPPPEPPPPAPASQKLPNFCMDDNDEDLELRMIALRSAVLKKHRARMQHGGKRKKPIAAADDAVPRMESPFTSTFLEDFPLLAEICSPASPLSSKRDIYSTEDMELDSDMELDKEIVAVMSGAEDQSPYSPSDDILEEMLLAGQPEVARTRVPQVAHGASTPVAAKKTDTSASLYTPSNPTETPALKALGSNSNVLDGSILEFASQSSRPYSPSDATFYDPDLPGVHSSPTSSKTEIPPPPPPPPGEPTTTSTAPLPPLPPPPLPPISMFGCPTNLLTCPFVYPVPIVPPSQLTSFPALHQSVNPLLLPNGAPLFASYPTASLPTVPTPSVSNDLDDFMETDLDGSPLVPMEKDAASAQLANWSLIREPLYLQGVPELTQSNISKLPMLMERSLVPAAVLRCNKQLQKQPVKKSLAVEQQQVMSEASLFRNAEMRPVVLEEEDARAGNFKPIKLQAQPKKSVTTQPDVAFDATAEDVAEEEPKKEEKKKEEQKVKEKERVLEKGKEKTKKPVATTPLDRKRKRKKSTVVLRQSSRELVVSRRTTREAAVSERRRELRERNSRLIRGQSVSRTKKSEDTRKKTTTMKEEEKAVKLEDKRRRSSVDDDEDALREILLASLAKRVKEQSSPVVKTPPRVEAVVPAEPAKKKLAIPSESSPKTTTEDTPLVERVRDFLASVKRDKKEATTKPVAPSQTTSNQLKRPAATPLPLVDQPLRKIPKKASVIPASTKVVNNAKRYQNLLLQRKQLAQQQQQKISSRFKVNNNAATQVRSASPNVTKKPAVEIQRIIINLNEDTESESDVEEAKAKLSPTKSRPSLNIPTTDFERSVDQFLKNVRQQQEMASTTTKNNVSLPKPVKKVLPPMGPPTSTSTVTSAKTVAVTSSSNMTTAKATIAVTTANSAAAKSKSTATNVVSGGPTAATSVTAVTAGGAAANLRKEVVTSTPKSTKTEIKVPRISATPQAVKHLPASQQEEYRRLKMQIFERERLRLQKPKEPTAPTKQQPTTTGTSTAPTKQQPPTASTISEKPVNTPAASSPLSSPSPSTSTSTSTSTTMIASPALASSTPKAIPKIAPPPSPSSSPLAKPRELLTLSKPVPKTQLVATISPMSKQQPSIEPPAPLVPVASKLVRTTSQENNNNNIKPSNSNPSKPTALANKFNAASPRTPASSLRIPVQGNNNSHNSAMSKQHANLLDKMNEALNSQKKQITAVANKVSSLRILTREQINLKTTQIQQARSAGAERRVAMDDLNRSSPGVRRDGATSAQRSAKGNEEVDKQGGSNDSAQNSSLESSSRQQSWEEFKQVVNDEVQALAELSTEQQRRLLAKTEEDLITKRHYVLDDITEMSGNLRQWEIERDLQNILTIEIKKLREQLRIAEGNLQQQKEKLNTIQPKVSTYHEKINTGRKECFRLSKICNGIGQQIVGPNYKVPTAGAELLNNRIKEVATHTQKLRSKKTRSNDTVNTSNSAMTDKTKSKSNSKSNNYLNNKRKDANKQQNVNNKTNKSASESVNTVGATETEESPKVISNVSTNLNVEHIVNTKVENEPMDISIENQIVITDNIINTKTETTLEKTGDVNSILKPENNLNIPTETEVSVTNTDHSYTILTTEKILNPEVEKQLSESSATIAIVKTENIIYTESDKQLTNTVNSILTAENTLNSDNKNMSMQSILSNTILNSQNVESESEKSLTESDVANSVLIANEIHNSETENHLTNFNAENSVLNDVQNNNQTFSAMDTNNAISIEENIIVSSVHNTILIEKNVNTESETPSTEISVDDSVSIKENTVCTERENASLESVENSISVEENVVQNNSENVSTEVHIIRTDNISTESKESTMETEAEKVLLQENTLCTENEKTSSESIEENSVSIPKNIKNDSENVSDETCIIKTDNVSAESKEPVVDTVTEDINLVLENSNNELEKPSTDTESTVAPTPLSIENEENNFIINDGDNVENCKSVQSEDISNFNFENYLSSTSEISTSVEHSTLMEEITLLELANAMEVPDKIIRDFGPATKKNCDDQLSKQMVACKPLLKNHEDSKKKAVQPYESILKHLQAPRNNKTDGILCPYELMGTCHDGDCQYIHQSTSHCQ